MFKLTSIQGGGFYFSYRLDIHDVFNHLKKELPTFKIIRVYKDNKLYGIFKIK